MLIEQLPPILIIHLKCFLYDESDGTKKVNKSINYTVNLTLPKSKIQLKEIILFKILF
jgi:ubiquitin carboxyl-terminal hydrolase 10